MNPKRILCTAGIATIAAGVLLFATGTAGADPTNAVGGGPAVNGGPFTIHCDTLGDLMVVVQGNGEWTHSAIPMHEIDTNQTLLGYLYRYEVTPVGQPPFVVEGEKPAPQSGRLDVCRFSQTFPQGTVDVTIGVSYTP